MSASEHDFSISEDVIYIYSWFIYGALCQIINVFGIVTNIINSICFVKQGFQDSVNISLLGLSVSDLGSLVTFIWTSASVTPAFMTADLPFEPIGVCFLTSGALHFAFTRVSSCITAMITLERCICITAPFKIKSIITPQRVTIITICIFVISFVLNTPIYVVNRLGVRFSPIRNKTLLSLISTQDREIVETVTFAVNNCFIPFGSFFIIAVCMTILSSELHRKTEWRKMTINLKEIDKVSSRNQKTASMVLIVSTLFIICFIPVSIIMLAITLIPDLHMHGKYFIISIFIAGFSFAMESINSSMNIFIYYHMSSRYRDIFNRMFSIK